MYRMGMLIITAILVPSSHIHMVNPSRSHSNENKWLCLPSPSGSFEQLLQDQERHLQNLGNRSFISPTGVGGIVDTLVKRFSVENARCRHWRPVRTGHERHCCSVSICRQERGRSILPFCCFHTTGMSSICQAYNGGCSQWIKSLFFASSGILGFIID